MFLAVPAAWVDERLSYLACTIISRPMPLDARVGDALVNLRDDILGVHYDPLWTSNN